MQEPPPPGSTDVAPWSQPLNPSAPSQPLPAYPVSQPFSQPLQPFEPPTVLSSRPTRRGWRLTALLALAAIAIAFLVAYQPQALAQTRMSAFPKPSMSLSVQSGSAIHVGDTVQFALNVTTGRQLTYRWDFGDGSDLSPQSSDTARHTYSDYGHYNITVTATDPIGQEASDSASVEVLPLPPHASLATPTPVPDDPLTINFDGSASTGTELTYHWDYGDGVNEDADATTSHSYTASGTYKVTLQVTDVAGQTDSTSAPVTIQVAGPVARFTSSQTYYDPYYPYACYDFDASSSTGYNLSYSSFSWSFGDGSGSSGQTTSNCFYGAGTYAVRLQVTDALGQTSAVTHYVSV